MHRFPAAASFGDSHPGVRRRVREFNPCHDPASGKFCSGSTTIGGAKVTVPFLEARRRRTREANPCHDDASGRFTFKGRGRCLGVEARLAARRDYEKVWGKWGADARVDVEGQDVTLLGQGKVGYDKRTLGPGETHKVLKLRRDARQFGRRHTVPSRIQQAEQDSRYADATVTLYQPPTAHTRSPGSASMPHRMVFLEPTPTMTSQQEYDVAQHEYGHIDRTPLGRGGRRVGGYRLSPTQAEEVRAWKNAIRNSGGKIGDESFMADSLASYFTEHQTVVGNVNKALFKGTARAFMKFPTLHGGPGRYPRDFARSTWNDIVRDAVEEQAQKFTNEHIMPYLRRYIRRVKRAAKES